MAWRSKSGHAREDGVNVVIRPAAFANGVAPRPLTAIAKLRRRRLDGQIASILLGLGMLACIIAIAGTAFTIRAILVLCFATLAGRARRVGLQPRRF
jgi:hypothetical protein